MRSDFLELEGAGQSETRSRAFFKIEAFHQTAKSLNRVRVNVSDQAIKQTLGMTTEIQASA